MKIHFNDYNHLLNNLSEIQSVTDDSSNGDTLKSFVFKIKKAEADFSLNIIGMNGFITFRKKYPNGKFNITLDENDNAPFNQDGILSIGINAKEIIDFLNTYKSSTLTYVEGVSLVTRFDDKGVGKVTCIVFEAEDSDNQSEEEKTTGMLEFIGDDDDDESDSKEVRHTRSQWVFDLTQITKSMHQAINFEVPESEMTTVNNQMMYLVTSNLIPLLDNQTTLYSYINFTKTPEEDGDLPSMAIVFSNAFTTFLSNFVVNEVFNNIRLNYKVMNFIDKIVISNHNDADASFEASKMEGRILLQWGSNNENEAIVVYDTKIAQYQSVLAARSKEYSFTINRIYLSDVIKRLSLVNDTATVTIEDSNNCLKLTNSKFEQEVAFIDKFNTEAIDNVGFRIKPDIFNKIVIGNKDRDENTEDDIIVYINPETAVLTFTTESGAWQSLVRVTLNKH